MKKRLLFLLFSAILLSAPAQAASGPATSEPAIARATFEAYTMQPQLTFNTTAKASSVATC